MATGGGSPHDPKEEPLKKNPIKKTTTPTSSFSAESVDKSSSSFSENEKQKAEEAAAIALKTMLEKEADKPSRQWGNEWYMPLKIFKDLIYKYGIGHFHENLMYVVNMQISYDKGKSKKRIDNPEKYLRIACEKNYAETTNQKKLSLQ